MQIDGCSVDYNSYLDAKVCFVFYVYFFHQVQVHYNLQVPFTILSNYSLRIIWKKIKIIPPRILQLQGRRLEMHYCAWSQLSRILWLLVHVWKCLCSCHPQMPMFMYENRRTATCGRYGIMRQMILRWYIMTGFIRWIHYAVHGTPAPPTSPLTTDKRVAEKKNDILI